MLEKEGNSENILNRKKNGQVAIFIIVAIVIAVGIFFFLALKPNTELSKIPVQFQPLEERYLACIQDYSTAGISMLEEQGGYIELPEFEPGNDFAVSSNLLNFAGSAVPFWYYLSGKNTVKEQVPSKANMEDALAKYISDNLRCDFADFQRKGYYVNISSPKAEIKILNNRVNVNVKADFIIGFGDSKESITEHSLEIESKLGKFYNLAIQAYNQEKQEAFLEDYTVDALRLYAPVTGVELECAPKVWAADNVKNELREALEANTLMLKPGGTYYTLKNNQYKYFVTPVKSDEAIRFLYSKNWPTKINIDGSSNGIMSAEPVGNQEGLGVIGFCYVPYQFIYDIYYPVLIQIYDNQEIFQFPVVVMVEGNQKRKALSGNAFAEKEAQICKHKNADVRVYTYNTRFEPVEADLSFRCLDESCEIGRTKIVGGDAYLEGKFPQCVNGEIIAKAEGYAEKKALVSTNEESAADIVLDKLYNFTLSLKVDGKETGDLGLIYFNGDKIKIGVSWPQQKQVILSEGNYSIKVYLYRNSSIKIPGRTFEKCTNMPSPGLGGLLGMTKEQCFTMNIPEQELNNVVIGGGKNEWYISETELEENKFMDVEASSMSVPRSIEDVQDNYNALNDERVYIEFRK